MRDTERVRERRDTAHQLVATIDAAKFRSVAGSFEEKLTVFGGIPATHEGVWDLIG